MPACIFDAYNSYAGFPYLLRLNDQVVAGFRQVDLDLMGYPVGLFTRRLILLDGLSYDRLLLRWATHWRMSVWWLRYALFWLRPSRDLALEMPLEETGAAQIWRFFDCRALTLDLGDLQPDGAYPIHRLVIRYSTCLVPWNTPIEPLIALRICPSQATSPAGEARGSAALPGD